MQTFFSTAFLAALGTTLLILYLMTPPVSPAVQGAFVVAAVCTGAALGGLAVLFKDLAECLGCLLGGVSLSMWLLTLREGGLIENTVGRVIFIAVFAFATFCLYFSRWTRQYGLMACISFSGSTAAVLGIDCFSRAGLKEFWAYIWALNDRLFPDGADTYPLTRGIRVELAVTVLLFVVGIVSQLKLWRLIRDRRNKSKEEPAEEAPVQPDEEASIGRQVQEVTNRERAEWERMYGNGGAANPGSPDSVVGDMVSEKSGRSKRNSAVSLVEAVASEEPAPDGGPVPKLAEQTILQQDAADGRVMVRVVQDDEPEGGPMDGALADETAHEDSAPATKSTPQPGPPEPTIVPLPFTIPAPRDEGDKASVADDQSSVAAIADDEEHEPTVAPSPDIEDGAEVPRNSTSPRDSMSQYSASPEQDVAGESYQTLALPVRDTRDDTDSVIATLDDESTSGYVEDWPPQDPEGSIKGSVEGEKQEETQTAHQQASPDPAADEAKAEVLSPSAEEPVQTANPEDAAASIALPNPTEDASLSAESLRTKTARLTKLNLPPALPGVALTYRTNEWAKHLSIADTPEPEALQLSQAVHEEPAYLDVADLQKTAENGAPPPAAPRTSSVLSNYAHAAVRGARTSLSGSEMPPQDSQPSYRPGMHPHTSVLLQRQTSALQTDPIAEEAAILPPHPTPSPPLSIHHRLSTPDLPLQQPKQPPTLISMREHLLRARASGIFPPPAADSLDPDDLPLSHRRTLLRQSSLTPQPQITADTTPFNSHQPARTSTLPSEAARQAQLASFRSSVAADLRKASPSPNNPYQSGGGAGGLRRISSSSATLLGQISSSSLPFPGTYESAIAMEEEREREWEREKGGGVLRSMELQRSILLGQKEAELRQKEAERIERERFERGFEERMRSGALMGAHRDAMRRLQGGVKPQ